MAASSSLVGGTTLHSMLFLPVNNLRKNDLSEDAVLKLRETFKDVKLLIIDECFMVG
jgi:hypothetical protein